MSKIPEQQDIESQEFSVRTQIASGLDVFLDVIANDKSVLSLTQKLNDNPKLGHQLILRIRELIDHNFDEQYANPHDVAVATYGWLVGNSRWDLYVSQSVDSLLMSLKNSWWSKHVANQLEANRIDISTHIERITSAWLIVTRAHTSNLFEDLLFDVGPRGQQRLHGVTIVGPKFATANLPCWWSKKVNQPFHYDHALQGVQSNHLYFRVVKERLDAIEDLEFSTDRLDTQVNTMAFSR